MATCAELEQQAQQAANKLKDLAAEGRIAASADLNNIGDSRARAEQYGGDAARVLFRINETLSALEKIQVEQVRQDCPRQGFFPEKRAAKDARDQINAFIDKMDVIINKAREQEAASQKASQTQDNAGTGKPGTAGQGPGATPDPEELNEIEITTKKKPESIDPLTEPLDTGPIEVTEPKINTGNDLTVDEPGLQDAGVVDVDDPNFDLTDEEIDEFLEEDDPNTNQGVPGATNRARAQATLQDTTNFKQKEDWRVRLSLSPGATYLYKDPNNKLLAPLGNTDGVIFPYTPSIAVNYNASYGTVNPAHSNYTIYQYQNSSVDSITLTCDFTAQDTYEANYLLAVIHFFRSVTKMFYGKDQNPKQGTPPPLCYLFGLGEFQFNAHPLAVTAFSYNLPNNVDYIRATNQLEPPGAPRSPNAAPSKPATRPGAAIQNMIVDRLSQGIASIGARIGLTLTPGGSLSEPGFGIATGFNSYNAPGTIEPTYVPTSITITVTCIPIVSRYEISTNFSLKQYADGSLLNGVKRAGGGFW